ncbi:MAG: hypothetical protein DRP27_06730 [Thermotogae bacterium]|nr:MAG: hypothetical protein DRP27_06730 [Thermotogota bacterium]
MSKIALIGAGNMAGEIGKRLIRYGGINPKEIIATHYDTLKAQTFMRKTGIKVVLDNAYAAKNSKIIILCIRPQQVKDVIEEIAPVFPKEHAVLINIAVGVNLKWLSNKLQTNKVIHFHPTSLLMITQRWNPGISLWAFHPQMDRKLESKIRAIFEKSISEIWVVSEEEMPILIFITGNSPAYFTRIIKSFVLNTQNAICNDINVRNLYYAIMKAIYTGLILEQNEPDEIIKSIATRQGVTCAGLDFLEDKLQIDNAIKGLTGVTIKRIREISKEFQTGDD